MANFGNYQIPPFEDDIPTIKEFFKIILNTIFFHRWLGNFDFEEVESIFPNITYIRLKSESLQKSIEANISLLENSILKSNRAVVKLNFYQEKTQRFFIMQQLTNLWESWEFIFILKKNSDLINSLKEHKIREYLRSVLEKLNDKCDFMPDLNFEGTLPTETFPYEIIIKSNYSDNAFLELIKEMSIKSALKEENI